MGFGESLMECRSTFKKWLQATEWIPRYINGSRIRTGDSLPNRRYPLQLPSFLFRIGEQLVVRGLLLRLA
ncbi:hypothetical protein HAX54_024231, partial [Datura stramonium]|nr:hypothetical protein [Datura stramonium]